MWWVKDNKGEYNWDKEENEQKGTLPVLKKFEGQDICWCDIFTYYLLHLEQWNFYATLSPYKGEIYIKRTENCSDLPSFE